MGSTKFISLLGDETLAERLFDVVKADGDRLVETTVDRSDDGHTPFNVTLTYETRLDGEDEDSTLQDTYEVDDYDIVPFDWGGDTTGIILAWRRWLFGMFGDEYATWHLLGHLEQVVDGGGGWNLDA